MFQIRTGLVERCLYIIKCNNLLYEKINYE
nr:MAG TPA: hypothetical protein [Caudoviricetes sp.]